MSWSAAPVVDRQLDMLAAMLPSAPRPHPRLPTALLLGDAARLPFVGHLRRCFPRDAGGLTVAARVGAGAPGAVDPEMPDMATPYRAARALERTLVEALSTGVSDRHDLLRSLWAAVASVPAGNLGRAQGADLTLLAVAADADGVGVAGVGLAGVFGQGPAGLISLVQAGHPLLAAPGLPRTTPGVLTLDSAAPDWIIGLPVNVDQSLQGRGLPEILLRCGVRA